MADILAPDFDERFNKDDAVVGVIGQGFVGGAMRGYFERHGFKVVAYDKFQSKHGTLEDVVKRADVVFICVPTPMRSTGECYTGIVEEVLDDVERASRAIGRPSDTFVACIKSTVPPGFTSVMQLAHPMMRITFSPEYLTEASPLQDMLTASRVVVAGDPDDTRVVLRFFKEADRDRYQAGWVGLIAVRDPAVAEMAKLMANGLLATKVSFCNEIYRLCQAMGIDYETTRQVVALDERIGLSHTQVPGPDGHMGFGGSCFIKDLNDLIHTCEVQGVPERIFTAVWDRNQEHRPERDWEGLKDRAVTDK